MWCRHSSCCSVVVFILILLNSHFTQGNLCFNIWRTWSPLTLKSSIAYTGKCTPFWKLLHLTQDVAGSEWHRDALSGWVKTSSEKKSYVHTSFLHTGQAFNGLEHKVVLLTKKKTWGQNHFNLDVWLVLFLSSPEWVRGH